MVLLGVGQFAQHILQVVVDHQMMPMRTADDAVQLQAPRCCLGMPQELPVVSADCEWPNDLFRLGIVDRNSWITEVQRQCRPLVPQIPQRFADPAAGQRPLRCIALQPASHAVPDRHRLALRNWWRAAASSVLPRSSTSYNCW